VFKTPEEGFLSKLFEGFSEKFKILKVMSKNHVF